MALQLSFGETIATGPRAENQDAIRLVTPAPALAASKGYLFALADGVSQCADGGLASRATPAPTTASLQDRRGSDGDVALGAGPSPTGAGVFPSIPGFSLARQFAGGRSRTPAIGREAVLARTKLKSVKATCLWGEGGSGTTTRSAARSAWALTSLSTGGQSSTIRG